MIWTIGAIALLFVFTGTGFAADAPIAATAPTVINPATGALNWWTLAGALGNVLFTNVVMVLLKKSTWYQEMEKRAWLPLAIGLIGGAFGAMATGSISDAPSLTAWLVAGIAAGGTASSARDTLRDFKPVSPKNGGGA